MYYTLLLNNLRAYHEALYWWTWNVMSQPVLLWSVHFVIPFSLCRVYHSNHFCIYFCFHQTTLFLHCGNFFICNQWRHHHLKPLSFSLPFHSTFWRKGGGRGESVDRTYFPPFLWSHLAITIQRCKFVSLYIYYNYRG